MAVTYGSANLGSSSNGGFAIYTVADSVGAAPISILVADFATNRVTAAPSAVPLTSLQTAALSTLLAKLRTAAPSASTLAVLRKLVGVVTMTDGAQVTLSVSSVGAVHTLRAALSVAGSALVYVPNAAAAGLFTGFNSSDPSSVGPSGAAGGILGYAGSTYPDPSGLAANASHIIPMKNDGNRIVYFTQDDAAANPSGVGIMGGQNTDPAALGEPGFAYASASDTVGGGGAAGLGGGDAYNGGTPAFGAAIIAEGANGTTKKGGNARVDAGSGFGGSGDVMVADANAARVIVGTKSAAGTQNKPPVLVKSPVEEQAVAQTVVAGDVLGNASAGVAVYYNISSAGAVTLGANPLKTPYQDVLVGAFGQRAVIYNSGGSNITFPHSATFRLSGSLDCVLAPTGILTMAYVPAVGWVETGRIATSG